MRVLNAVTRELVRALFIVTSAVALGADGVNVTIDNNTSRNLVVSVYDLNTNPVVRVLSDLTINGFAWVSATLVADASGEGHLSWTATTTDQDMRRCSHADRPHLNDGDTVNVHAGSKCGKWAVELCKHGGERWAVSACNKGEKLARDISITGCLWRLRAVVREIHIKIKSCRAGVEPL